MALTPVVGVGDGPRLTVNQMLKSPTTIPRRILSMMDQQFIADVVFRSAGSAPSGAVVYEETAPQYADDDPMVVEEFAEIPVTQGQVGTPKVIRTVYRSLAIMISERMRSRNNVDAVNRVMQQVRNSMVRAHEKVFLQTLLTNPSVLTFAGSAPWATASTNISNELVDASLLVTNAVADPTNRPEDFLGYTPDTLVMGTTVAANFMKNSTIQAMFVGNLADENLMYKLTMPGRWGPYRVLISRQMDILAPLKVIMLERGTVGGIVDERPLRATPLYEDKPRESWRSDVSRASGMFVDNPKAAVILDTA